MHCHKLAHSSPRLRVGAWRKGKYVAYSSAHHHRFIIICPPLSSPGCGGNVTETVYQAPCQTHPRLAMPLHLRRFIALISVVAIPCAPLGSPSPTFYAALPNHTIVLLVLPFPRIQHNGTWFRPAPSFLLAFLPSSVHRPPHPTSALQRVNLGGIIASFIHIHSFSTGAPGILCHASHILLTFTYMNVHVGGQNRLSGAVQFLVMLKVTPN